MQTNHATASEITRDIIVAMIGSASGPVSTIAVQNVVDAFEKIYNVVEKKWQSE